MREEKHNGLQKHRRGRRQERERMKRVDDDINVVYNIETTQQIILEYPGPQFMLGMKLLRKKRDFPTRANYGTFYSDVIAS